jgi:hypothetical protein
MNMNMNMKIHNLAAFVFVAASVVYWGLWAAPELLTSGL